MRKTIIQRGALVLAALAAGGALAVVPSASLASSNSHNCGNASHARSVKASNTSCRTARYWAVRNRCPQHWSQSGEGTTTIGGARDASASRTDCTRGRQSISWIHTSGGGGSGTTTIGG